MNIVTSINVMDVVCCLNLLENGFGNLICWHHQMLWKEVELAWNLVAHGDAREGK